MDISSPIEDGHESRNGAHNRPLIAEKITKDHLAEFDNYYTALAEMENKLKKNN